MSNIHTIQTLSDKLEEKKALGTLGDILLDASHNNIDLGFPYPRSVSISSDRPNGRRPARPQRSSSSMSSSSTSSSVAESVFSSTSSRDSSCYPPNRSGPDASQRPHVPDFTLKTSFPSGSPTRREQRLGLNSLGQMHNNRPLTARTLGEEYEDDGPWSGSRLRSDGMSGNRSNGCETIVENSTNQRHHGRNPLPI